ncbi:MAG: molybdate transport system substrate-binding protein [Alphaproteobacteria bacterium]|jgi:molybdate transport system substrate-binding protein
MPTLEVLSAGAVKPAMALLTPVFEQARRAKVAITFGPAPELREITKDGTGLLGLVAGPKQLVVDLVTEGKLDGASRQSLGGVKAAIALHKDAPVPDLSTPDAVRDAIQAADRIVFNTASSGQYIADMIDRLGIGVEVADRIQRYPNAEEAMVFLASDAGRKAIGFGQSSALRGYESLGVRQVAALPEAIGNVTEYEAALCKAAPDAVLARDFLDFIISVESRAVFLSTGVE